MPQPNYQIPVLAPACGLGQGAPAGNFPLQSDAQWWWQLRVAEQRLHELQRGQSVAVKVRSAGQPVAGAFVRPLGDGRFAARFEAGIHGVAPGQSAVFYDGDVLLGGGIIGSAE